MRTGTATPARRSAMIASPFPTAGMSDEAARTTWYCLRRGGAARRSGWIPEASLDDLHRRVGARPEDSIEVSMASDFRPVPRERFSKVFYNRVRGRVGMEITCGGETERLAPTRMLAQNLSFARALERFCERRNIAREEFAARGALRAFSARQFLVSGDGRRVTELFRGSVPVPPNPAPGEDRAGDLADGIGRWMLANTGSDGSLPYKYWPSRGEGSPADNAIRRFLASLALARLGELRGDADLREAARRNLRFNLKRYFQGLGDGRGAIVEETGAKLGAAALAGLAILESPAGDEFRTELGMLTAGVNSLVHEEHGFRTFFFPAERDGQNWNFYSGEALLFWAEALRRKIQGAPSPEQCEKAFARCRDRHRRARNPAFIPWHTQACSALFGQTGQRAYADFTFEMNDWLLPMQQGEGLPEDLRGRFFDPLRPDFGPPHAASTGAYLEGLADAAALARAVGDRGRAAAYARAIERGLRSLRQLQFRGAEDAFYVSKRRRVMGALRVEAYDNTIRLDSAAHALAAAVKLLRARDQPEPGRAK